jgi:hypothetical protein
MAKPGIIRTWPSYYQLYNKRNKFKRNEPEMGLSGDDEQTGKAKSDHGPAFRAVAALRGEGMQSE